VFARRTNWQLTPNRLSQVLDARRQAGLPILDLTESNPTRCGFRYDDARILAALSDLRTFNYQPVPKGLPHAREHVAAYYRDRQGSTGIIDPEFVVLTTSTSEAYSFIFRLLCDPDDEVLVPSPSYPLFEFLGDVSDVKLVPYPLIYDHGWHIDLPSLKKALNDRTRAVVVVNPNNPTGSYVHDAERRALNEVCSSRHLAIIADEVFLDYSHIPSVPVSFAVNQTALTFVLIGISKISALPQMKLAWIAVGGPAELTGPALEKLEIIADTFLSMNTPIQLATSVLLEERRNIQPQLQQRIGANLKNLDQVLATRGPCQRLEIEGGWYAVLRVPAIKSDEELAVELLEREGVFVHPGHFYDFPSDGYLVLSLITPEKPFAEGIERILRTFS